MENDFSDKTSFGFDDLFEAYEYMRDDGLLPFEDRNEEDEW